MKRILLLLSLILSCWESALAAQETFYVTWVGSNPNSQIIFIGVDHAATSSPCLYRTEILLNLSAPGVKELMAVAMAAMLAQKQLTLGIDEANCILQESTAYWGRVNN